MSGPIVGFEVYAQVVGGADPSLVTPEDLALLHAAAADARPTDLSAEDLSLAAGVLQSLTLLAPGKDAETQQVRIERFLQARTHTLLSQQFAKALAVGDYETFTKATQKYRELAASMPGMRYVEEAGSDRVDRHSLVYDGLDGQTVGTHVYKSYRIEENAEGYATIYHNAGVLQTTHTVHDTTLKYFPVGGTMQVATVRRGGTLREVVAFLEVVVQAEMAAGMWDLSHQANLRRLTPGELQEMLNGGIGCIAAATGCILHDETHGAVALNILSLQGGIGPYKPLPIEEHTEHSMRVVGVEYVSVLQLLEGYKYSITLPPPTDRTQLPRIDAQDGSGRMTGKRYLDAYQFLAAAMRLIPVGAWDIPWITHTGDTLTFRALMDRVADTYLHHYQWTESVPDHGFLHLPALLARYYALAGQDPNIVKRAFLARELTAVLGKRLEGQSLSVVGHLTESLGALLAEPKVMWRDAEASMVRAWIQKVKAYVQTLDPAAVDDECAHLLKGLRLMAQHAAKIGWPPGQ